MSRLLVLGMGLPSFVPAKRHAGPGLRTAHFATALSRAGHELLLVCVLDEGEALPVYDAAVLPAAVRLELLREMELLEPSTRRRLESFAPDAVVGVTVYAASLAARLQLAAPLWADVFGDLMAEAQAKAARVGSDWSIVHFWTLLRGVLESADRFSAVSLAQSQALKGQLGLAGRLSARTAGEELVAVLPCAAEASGASRTELREASRRRLGYEDGDFVLLLSGGTNTWCDVDTLAAALAAAFAENESLRLLVTGGAIANHDEASHARLRAALAGLDARRVRELGWIDSAELPAVYAAADLALHIELPLYERELGAENRVVEWLAAELPCATTGLSETGRELVASGLALGCEAGDARALATLLLEAPSRRAELAEAARRARRWVLDERSYERTAAPLVDWCAKPTAARDRDGARLLQIGLLSHPERSVEMLEAYVAALPLREIARRGLRWVWRRGVLSLRRALSRSRAALSPRSRRAGSRSLLPLLAIVAPLAIGGGSGCEPGRSGPAKRPNILLLTIDTLRADHLGAYGYQVQPSPTPWMDRLAAGGVLFEQAVTTAPETAPAVASIVTGLYQDRHGLAFNRASLPEEQRPLAERLKEAGYRTAAFLGNWLVGAEHGFGQGFDSMEVVQSAPLEFESFDDRLVSRAGDFLRAQKDGDAPWLLWVHMMDPHGPYNSATSWWSRDLDYSRLPPLAGALPGALPPVSDSNFGLDVIPRYQQMQGLATLADYVRRYDGELRFTDAQVGALLGMLHESGEAEDTVIVVTADHGESLSEHRELLQHGWFVYDTTIRIPLLVSWAAGIAKPSRVKEVACATDLVPTLLDLAGVAADGADFDGRSLLPELGLRDGALAGASVTPLPAEAATLREAGCFSIGPRQNHPFALRQATRKLILTPAGAPTDPKAQKGTRSEEPERIEIYDLAADPGELHDLSRRRADLVEELSEPVSRLRTRFRAAGLRW